MKNLIFNKTEDEKRIFFLCVISTFLWGLIAHAYGFLNSGFSHDVLNALYADAVEETWKIQLGRFFVPIYRMLRGQVALPWLIGLISLLFLSISVYFVIKCFNINSAKLIILIAGVMTTNITITAQAATYIYELDFNMLALLLNVIAAYIWKNYDDIRIFGGVLLIAVSIAIYQSYLSVFLSLVIFISVMQLLNNKSVKSVFARGLKGAAMALFAGVLYFITSSLIYKFTGIQQEGRTNVLNVLGFGGIDNVPLFYAKTFLETYDSFLGFLISDNIYPKLLSRCVVIAVAVLYAFILWHILTNKAFSPAKKISVLALILILPFAMNITYFLAQGWGVHHLMIYAVWFVYVFLLVMVYWFVKSGLRGAKINKILTYVCYAIAAVFLWQSVIISNNAYLKKDLEAKSTLSLMTRVVARMEEQEDYIPGETEVAILGISNLYRIIPGFENTFNITGLYYRDSVSLDDSRYYYNAYDAYFKYILNYPIKLCDDNKHYALKGNKEYQEMPCFPNKDCIKMIDGVMVVKMQ